LLSSDGIVTLAAIITYVPVNEFDRTWKLASFSSRTASLNDRPGFEFAPARDRRCRVWSTGGRYHAHPEWTHNIPHPVEAARGMEAAGDAYSPGWFELTLPKGAEVIIVVCADEEDPAPHGLRRPRPALSVGRGEGARDSGGGEGDLRRSKASQQVHEEEGTFPEPAHPDLFAAALARAASTFVVRRDDVRTVIAGYPWFLDWGRDSLIAARGLLAADGGKEVGR
jgi:glycogen debranching enzyme